MKNRFEWIFKQISGAFLTSIFVSVLAFVTAAEAGQRNLLIILDGLRPDYVTAEVMPNLEAWSHDGVVCRKHHSVFPTVTRVNSAVVATGCYPEKNGLLGNSIFFPTLSPVKGLNTGSREVLLRIEEETGGNLLTVPSLGEYLSSHGRTLLAISSGSSGSCTLLNHKGCGQGIIHTEFIVPGIEAKRSR